jgi:ribosomal protein S18 acetylase RimI-like enzyme
MAGDRLLLVAPGPARERMMDLLLLADESPQQVAGYLHDGDLFAFEDADGVPLALTLVLYDGDDAAELKAVAVRPDQQGQGVGKRLLTLVLDRLRDNGVRRVVVATGTSSLAPLALYQKLGFRLCRIERDFFSPERGYPAEIVENGIRLRDLVWLDQDLG